MAPQGHVREIDLAVIASHVANEFVKRYYRTLHLSPDRCCYFYHDVSTASRQRMDGSMIEATGREDIGKMIATMEYIGYKADIQSTDSYFCGDGDINIFIVGFLNDKADFRRKFAQSVLLARGGATKSTFWIVHDIMRFIDESPSAIIEFAHDESPSAEATSAEAASASATEPEPSPPTSAIATDPEPSPPTSAIATDPEPSPPTSAIATDPEPSPPTSATTTEDKPTYLSALKAPISVIAPMHVPVALPPSRNFSIVVKQLPYNVDINQIRNELIRFGPIGNIEVTRKNGGAFAFVEFEEKKLMDAAIEASKASSVTIGLRNVTITKKRY